VHRAREADGWGQANRFAAEHLNYGIRNFAQRDKPEALERAKEMRDLAQAEVATIDLRVTPAGADIVIDEKPAGSAPLEGEIFLDPGEHEISATAPGHLPARETLNVEAGETRAVTLALEEDKTSASAESPAAPPDTATTSPLAGPTDPHSTPGLDSGRSLVPVYIGAGVTAVATTLAVVFAVGAKSDSDELDELRERTGRFGCSTGAANASDCQQASDAVDSHDAKATGFAISASVGVVAALATLGYLFWPEPDNSSGASASRRAQPRWQATAGLSERGAELVVSGVF
jgi:hypothetical protein